MCNLNKIVVGCRCRWTQLILRMTDTRITELTCECTPTGRINLGRQRERWRDQHSLLYSVTAATGVEDNILLAIWSGCGHIQGEFGFRNQKEVIWGQIRRSDIVFNKRPLRYSPFWVISKQHWMVVLYRRFGTTYRSHLQRRWDNLPSLKIGPVGCPETSVQNYHSALSNIVESRRYLHCGGSLKSSLLYFLTKVVHAKLRRKCIVTQMQSLWEYRWTVVVLICKVVTRIIRCSLLTAVQ
jgi:hypothetical protein